MERECTSLLCKHTVHYLLTLFFSSHLLQILCNKQIPSWINRLASAGARLPFLEKMLPKEWLTPLALEEAAEHDDAANVEQVIFTEKKLLPRDATEL